MSRKYKFHNPQGIYFVSFATINWIDVFTRPQYKDILVESLNYCIAKKGLVVYAWVILSNHVHLVISTHKEPLENIMRDLKKHTSKIIIKAIEENPREIRRGGCCGCFNGQDNEIPTTSSINFGSNTINRLNSLSAYTILMPPLIIYTKIL